jgi:hypothetical protein
MSPANGRRPTGSAARFLVQEQIDYYEARATEYDQQLESAGRYADRAIADDLQGRDIDEAQSALEQLTVRGDVLELACGTGWWTTRRSPRTSTTAG